MNAAPGNLLLVGAGGFIGPWLARATLAAGWKVTGISRRGTADYGAGYLHVPADASNLAEYRAHAMAAQAVVYNAAYIPENFSDPAEADACMKGNAQIPLTLLGLLADQPRPFIYISTAQGYRTATTSATETTPVFPAGHASYYLTSKLVGEIYTEHYRTVHEVPAAVLRLGSIYGPVQPRGMVRKFIDQARAGQRIVLAEGGRHKSDLTFVGDVGSAVAATLARGATGIFNIASGRQTSALEAARQILAVAGRSEDQLEIQPTTGNPIGFAEIDITRAKRELAFAPTSSSEGLSRTMREWR